MEKYNRVEIADGNFFREVLGNAEEVSRYKERIEEIKQIRMANIEKRKELGNLLLKIVNQPEMRYKESSLLKMGVLLLSLSCIDMNQLICAFHVHSFEDICNQLSRYKNTENYFKKFIIQLKENTKYQLSERQELEVWKHLLDLIEPMNLKIEDKVADKIADIEILNDTFVQKMDSKNLGYSYRIAHIGDLNYEGRRSIKVADSIIKYIQEKKIDVVIFDGNLLSPNLSSKELEGAKHYFKNVFFHQLEAITKSVLITNISSLDTDNHNLEIEPKYRELMGVKKDISKIRKLGEYSSEDTIEETILLKYQLPKCSDEVRRSLKNRSFTKQNGYQFQEVRIDGEKALQLKATIHITHYGNQFESLREKCEKQRYRKELGKSDSSNNQLGYYVFVSNDGNDLGRKKFKLPTSCSMNLFLTNYTLKKQPLIVSREDPSSNEPLLSYYAEQDNTSMIMNRGYQLENDVLYLPIDVIEVAYPKEYLERIAVESYQGEEKKLKFRK